MDDDRLADVRAAVDEEVSDPEEQRQLMVLADDLDRHYRGQKRGAWGFTAGVAAAALVLLVGGSYELLNRPLIPVSPAAGSPALAVTAAVPMATEVPAGKIASAYRPAGLALNTTVGLMAGRLADGDTAVLVWNMSESAGPLEEVVLPNANAILTPSQEKTAWFPVASGKAAALGPSWPSQEKTAWFPVVSGRLAALGPSWATVLTLMHRGEPPALSFVALPSGSFPGLPAVPIHYVSGVSPLTGGRLVLVKVAGLDPAYWLINTNGRVMAVGSTLAAPMSTYGTVQQGLPALEQLLGL